MLTPPAQGVPTEGTFWALNSAVQFPDPAIACRLIEYGPGSCSRERTTPRRTGK